MIIAAAGNVEVPAYLALLAKSYLVSRSADDGVWAARKGETVLSADGPLPLLGLAAMLEQRGDKWEALDNEIDDFFLLFPPN